MEKDARISMRIDSDLKQQAEEIMGKLGVSMTAAFNMFLHQIVNDRALPLSLTLPNGMIQANQDIKAARAEREAGFSGIPASEVASKMHQIIMNTEER